MVTSAVRAIRGKRPSAAKRFGNGIDGEMAEVDGEIMLLDFPENPDNTAVAHCTEGFCPGQNSRGYQTSYSPIRSMRYGTVASCYHSEIFVGKMDSTKYSMAEIYEGKCCRVCHTSAAVLLIERCLRNRYID